MSIRGSRAYNHSQSNRLSWGGMGSPPTLAKQIRLRVSLSCPLVVEPFFLIQYLICMNLQCETIRPICHIAHIYKPSSQVLIHHEFSSVSNITLAVLPVSWCLTKNETQFECKYCTGRKKLIHVKICK